MTCQSLPYADEGFLLANKLQTHRGAFVLCYVALVKMIKLG